MNLSQATNTEASQVLKLPMKKYKIPKKKKRKNLKFLKKNLKFLKRNQKIIVKLPFEKKREKD
jgi:hypothetical protein